MPWCTSFTPIFVLLFFYTNIQQTLYKKLQDNELYTLYKFYNFHVSKYNSAMASIEGDSQQTPVYNTMRVLQRLEGPSQWQTIQYRKLNTAKSYGKRATEFKFKLIDCYTKEWLCDCFTDLNLRLCFFI